MAIVCFTLMLFQGCLFSVEWPDSLWILTLNIHLSFWLGRDSVTMGPWLLLCLVLVPSPRCYLAALEHLWQGRREEGTLSKSGVRLGLAKNPWLFPLQQAQRLPCSSCSPDGRCSLGLGVLKGLLWVSCDKNPRVSPVGHPGSGEPLTPALCHLLPFCCCLFVLGFSPLYIPTPLWEKSTFALQSLANRRGLYSIPMAAPGLQGSHDKSSGVCCQGDPQKHKFGSCVCVK